jgi:uncharacterized repeat protein (TIGR03803 family)
MRSSLVVILNALILVSCSGGALAPATRGIAPMGIGSHLPGAAPSVAGYKRIYNFKGTPDGAQPNGGLIAVNDTLYGVTLIGSKNYCSQSCFGNANDCWLGCGTVFSLDASGNEKIVYNFQGDLNGETDGSWPQAGLTLLNGRLLGTTSSAGGFGHGTVFTVDPSGNERVLHSFMGNKDGNKDGAYPVAPVIARKDRLYGTTAKGGRVGCGGGCGTVYSLTTTGKEIVLYRFKGGNDGGRSYPGLIALDDKLYGATLIGGYSGGGGCGTSGCGTIYELSLNGKERVLHRFLGGSDGANPNALVAVNGVLYGTTQNRGGHGEGTFFSITPAGTLKTLYTFEGTPDAADPVGTLLYSNGNFYGMSDAGGTGGGFFGFGSVFEVSLSGKERVLYSFQGDVFPQAPLYLFDGRLYGMTAAGGGSGCRGNGCGTIFSLTP